MGSVIPFSMQAAASLPCGPGVVAPPQRIYAGHRFSQVSDYYVRYALCRDITGHNLLDRVHCALRSHRSHLVLVLSRHAVL